MVNSFFDSSNEFATNELRKEYAIDMLDDLKFVYADTDGEAGLFFYHLLYYALTFQ